MVETKCKNCKHKWDYKGKSKFYVTCPKCYYKCQSPHKETKK